MNTANPRRTSRLVRACRVLAAAALTLAAGPGLAQAINDVPMAVKNNVAPNFIFMIDNSGSMSNIVPTAPYNAGTNYSGACPSPGGGIIVPAAGTTVELNVVGGIPFARIGGVNRRHTSVIGTGNRVCFDDSALYTAALLFPVSGYLPSQYPGRYLNWYFGNYDSHPTTGWTSRKVLSAAAIAAGQSVQTRMEIAQNSANNVISGLPASATQPTVRVGLATYNNGDGGRLVRALGDLTPTLRTNLISDVNALSPSGNTPLAETLADIGRYLATGYSGNITAGTVTGVSINTFLQQDGRQSCLSGTSCATTTTDAVPVNPWTGTTSRPIQYWCQRSYAFMLTDGRPQGDRAFSNNTHLRDYDGDCSGPNAANCSAASPSFDRKLARVYESEGSDYLDDVAKALFDVDLRPNLVAPAGRTKKNNLITYAIGFADPQVLNDPLLQNTAVQGGSGNALFPTSPAELTEAFRRVTTDAFAKDSAAAAVAVVSAQITNNNTAYLSSYRAGSWYGDLQVFGLNTSTGLPIPPATWSFRDNLNAQTPASRKIATYNGTTGITFRDASAFGAGRPLTLTAGVIDYLRGDRTGEGSTYRRREHVLGDLINAEPVVVNYPGGIPIVFQGSNGGMLHVVDGRASAGVPTSGTELWAYVPRLLHANLPALTDPAYAHRYYVDGTPTAAEVTGLSFSRILVGGLGKGGRGYYALNISDFAAATEADAASKVLWEFTHANMGFSFGSPLVVRTAAGWRVLVTSGYDNGTASGGDGGGHLWVLDPATGTVLATLSTGAGTATSPSGLAHVSRLSNSAPDAEVRYVWGGDLLGNVWRFDLVSNTATRIAQLTDTGGTAQPVTSQPTVSLVPGSSTRFIVMVGTGRYLADEDVPGNVGANLWSTQRQTLYGLLDNTLVSVPTMPNLRGSNGATCPTGGGSADLVCQGLTFSSGDNNYTATTHAVDWNSRRGWYLDLPQDGRLTNGRFNVRPALSLGGTLVVPANVPTNLRCDPGGTSWLLALSAVTGGSVVVNGSPAPAVVSLGPALSSAAVLVEGANNTRFAITRGTDNVTRSTPFPQAPGTSATWRRIYWRSIN